MSLDLSAFDGLDLQSLLNKIYDNCVNDFGKGKVADYIPKLATVEPKKFGMAIQLMDGTSYSVGDASERFSIQSISKVFALTIAMQYLGENIWNRVNKEPSGNPFNSLIQLEYENGIPRNPFINAGALVITDIILSNSKHIIQPLLEFVNKRANQTDICFDQAVVESELSTGHRNAALCEFMKSFNNIENDVSKVLNSYFSYCSLSMSCEELAKSFSYLANKGICPITNQQILSKSQTKRTNALMLTCGTYDSVGNFVYRVGLPGKSGVGGGIVAIIPEKMSICVWSPELNPSGNSLAGTNALEMFTTLTGVSIF